MRKSANHELMVLLLIILLCVFECKGEEYTDFINEPRPNISFNYPLNGLDGDSEKEDTSEVLVLNLKNISYNHDPPSPIPDVSPLCQVILRDLSEKASNFTNCTTANARPITICLNCMEHYYNYYNVYKNISVDNNNDCQNELLNRDRLMIVQSLNDYVSNMWRKAECENCYVHLGNETRLSNDTNDYFNKLNSVNLCIDKNKVQPSKGSKSVNDVCQICRKLYVALNEKYDKLNIEFNNKVCMDIVDHMNITHHLWSVEFHCVQPHFESYPVLILSVVTALIPLLFYIISRFSSSARGSEIVLQKRMSFVQSGSHSNLQRLH